MSNSTFYLAIYGSIISTFALAWNVIQYFRSRKGKLKIIATINTNFIVTHSKQTSSYISLDVKVVNLSEKTRYIKQPQFELDQRDKKFMTFLNLDSPKQYPIELSPGQEFKESYKLQELDKGGLAEVVADKFRVFLVDTHGKEYKSKWYNTKDFQLKE